MKVLVTGYNGQLGYDVIKRLEKYNVECIGVDIEDFDLTSESQTKDYILKCEPDVVVHCAAYTDVDAAEENKELCYNINVLGTRYVAEACKETNAKMVYFSTDYVFNGEGTEPFKVMDTPEPINYYGQTKYEGEIEVHNILKKFFIVRISWVFGSNGSNFVKTMLRIGKKRNRLSVVADQIGSPTYTYDLAKLLYEIIQSDKYGVYHATNEGYCSWYEFSVEIFKIVGMDVIVDPITTEEYPTKARRPLNSRLSKAELESNDYYRLPFWKESLCKFLEELNNSKNI